jgi:prepilin-type N-terminal cleavage/methylation domain-containing protein
MIRRHNRDALTLLEVAVVVVILATLAMLVYPRVEQTEDNASSAATTTNMVALRDVILDRYWNDMKDVLPAGVVPTDGYPRPNSANNPQSRTQHPQLYFLFVRPDGAPVYDPASRRGWNGPYLKHTGGRYPVPGTVYTPTYGQEGDPTVVDGWGRPIVLQYLIDSGTDYSRLVSAGPDGVINTPANVPYPGRDNSVCGDDIVLYLRVPDRRP